MKWGIIDLNEYPVNAKTIKKKILKIWHALFF